MTKGQPRSPHHSILVAAVLAATGLGCGPDKPHNPFGDETSSRPSATLSVSAAPTLAPRVLSASPAPGEGTTWPVGERTHSAPAQRRFGEGLVHDFDGDGVTDLVTTTRKRNKSGFDVRFYSAGGAETVLVELPEARDLGACEQTMSLALEAEVVLVRAELVCGGEKITRLSLLRQDPARSKAAPRPPRLAAELELPEHPVVKLEASDHDRDGHADLILTFSLREGGPVAPLILLDRPAGYSLAGAEPATSLVAHAERLVARPKVADAEVADLERLARVVCRGVRSKELPVSCTAGVGEVLGLLRGRQLLLQGDLLAAEALRDLLDDRSVSAKRYEQLLSARVPRRVAEIKAEIPTDTKPLGGALPPAAFDGDGNLLVDTGNRVVQIEGVTFTQSDSPMVRWPRRAEFRSGDATVTLSGLARRCDPPGRVLSASARGSETNLRLDSRLAVVEQLCTPRCERESLPLGLVSASPQRGAVVVAGGELFGLELTGDGLVTRPLTDTLAGEIAPVGAAQSADGKRLSVAAREAVLVRGERPLERWAIAGKQLTSCTPSPVRQQVACLTQSGSVVLVEPRP